MLSTTTEQDSDDSIYKYRRKSRRQRVSSVSSDSDDSVVTRPHRRKKCRVSSTSSDSDDSLFARPSRKKCKVLSESESDSTATSDSEEERNFQRRHDRRPNRHTVSSDSEAPSGKGSPKATNSAPRDVNSSDSDDGEKCIICFKSLKPPLAHPSNCSHHFHPNCLSTWTKTSNTCPIDRVKYTAILVVDHKGDLVSREDVTTPPPQDHNADFEPDDATFCEVCSQHDREHEMLLCDRCEAGYHLDCLSPPLREVPDGSWFCPRCTDLGNELAEEMNELMDDAAIILETRMRQRSAPTTRIPSRPRTSGAQRVFNIIHHQQTTNQPSTSSVTIRRRHTSSRRTRRSKSTRRPQSTRYKVELITVEDGTTLEVKVAVNTRTKSKRHSRRKSKKKCSKSSRKSDGPSTSRDTIFTGEGPSHALDLFGSRPQLDYFSGCEAEDELDEDGGRGGGVSAVSRGARPGVRNMASRKQIAAQIMNARPRRQAPRIEVSRAPVDLVSSIIEQQEKWHSPGATYESTTNGDIRVIMKERSSKIRQAGGSSGSSSGNAPSTLAQTSSSSREPLRDAGSSGGAGGSRDAYSASRPSSTTSSRNDEDSSKTSSSSERVPPPKMTSPAELDRSGKDKNEGSSRVTEGETISEDPSHDPSVWSESLIEKEEKENDDNKEKDEPMQGTDSKLNQDIAGSRNGSDKSDECNEMQAAEDSFHGTTDSHEDQRVPEDLSLKKTSKDSDEKVDNEVMEESSGADADTNSEKNNEGVECIDQDQQDDNGGDDDLGKQEETTLENYDVEADDEDSESEQDVAHKSSTLGSKVADIAATKEFDVDTHDGSIQSDVCRRDGPFQGKQEADDVEECKNNLVERDAEDASPKSNNIMRELDDNFEDGDEGKIESDGNTPEVGAIISGTSEDAVCDELNVSTLGVGNNKETPPSTLGIRVVENDKIGREIYDSVDDVDETKEVEGSNVQNDEDGRDSRVRIDVETPDVNALDYESNAAERLAVPGVGDNDTLDEEGSVVAASPSGKSEVKGGEPLHEEQTMDSEEDPDGSWPSNSSCSEPCSKDDPGDDCKGHPSVCSDENQKTKVECETFDSKIDVTESQQDGIDGTLEFTEDVMSVSENEQQARSEPAGDLLETGCEEDKDGLVDITDEEISSYERSWEMEENGDKKKTEGLEGLETEAISDCEYHPVEADISQKEEDVNDNQDIQITSGVSGLVEEASREEEGEIVTEEGSPVPKKKLPNERNDRGDVNKEKNKGTAQNDKQPDDRHDSRRVVAEKPRKKGDLVRDVSSDSGSTSLSSSIGSIISREKISPSRTRSRSRGRVKERLRDRARERSRERSKSRSRERNKDRSLSREKNRRNQSRDQQSRKRRRTRTPRRDRGRSRDRGSRDRKKRKRSLSSSCSSCSCSSCEREKKRNEKITVMVPREGTGRDRSRNRGKNKKDKRRSRSRNRKRKTPVPSKEVFTSGNNILVSVNFKSSNAEESGRTEGAPPSKRKKDNEVRKKKDKRAKENQPMRSAVSKKSPNRRKLNTSNMKPIAIIDLDASPFRETTLSPKEVIILTDSDDEEKMAKAASSLQVSGPKTPPEPHIKFSIANSIKQQQQQLRGIQNPLADKTGREGDDLMHIGPNTPPEPSAPYDPFEPTKSRSQSPGPTSRMDRIPSPAQEPKHHSPFQSQTSLTPPKLSQHDSPKTPSPLQCAPKDMDNLPEKNKQLPFQPAGMDSDDDSPGGGGDSPYSPGSSEGDDLFEPPMAQSASAPKLRQRPMASQSNKPKVQPPKVAMNAQKHSNHLMKDAFKKGPVKKDMGMKLDDDQWKILDDLPNSAVEMQVKDKFLKKLNRQERVVEEVKLVLKPHYAKKHVTKEEYKEILRRSVPKICHSRSGEINPMKIQRLIEAYVKKYRHKMKRKGVAPAIPPLRQNKPVVIKTQWA